MASLTHESLGMAILDCGCTKTVCGEVWMNVYLDILKEEDKTMIEVKKSDISFRFGDGAEVESLKMVKLPAMLGRKIDMIESNGVENEVPLLLSRSAMKRAEMLLDFTNDCAIVLSECVILRCTSGHSCIALTNMLLHDDFNSSQAPNIELTGKERTRAPTPTTHFFSKKTFF